jgi:hypothetical protein
MRLANLTLTTLAALSLGACGAPRQGVKGICTPFPATAAQTVGGPAAAASADPSAAVDDCLHRWAYSLAGASDPAEAVAQASVSACAAPLSRWNQQVMAPASGPGGDTADATSLVTGQPINAFEAHHEFAQGRALLYVVQARAGHCAPPPAAKGGPASSYPNV